MIDEKHIHDGHRDRMRAKLVSHGQHIFDTYELLEMLLYLVIPFKDTNPISKQLLHRFGSLDGVLSADRQQLLTVSGVGERACDLFALVDTLSKIIGGEIIPPDAIMSSYDKVVEHIAGHYSNKNDYMVALIMFDSNMNHIATCDLVNRDYESSAVSPALFVETAIRYNASIVITAHNHPFGTVLPSPGDRATNDLLRSAFDSVGITLLDHFLVSGSNYCSINENKIPVVNQTPAIRSFLENKKIYESENQQQIIRKKRVKYSTEYVELFTSLLSFFGRGIDVRDAADKLLTRYLTIENAMCADFEGLCRIVGKKVAVSVKLLAYVVSRRVTDLFKWGDAHSDAEISDYLKALYIGESVEKIYGIFFDKKGKTIACDLIGEGTVGTAEISPRKLLQAVIQREADGVAIAHNHPMGISMPSQDDVDMTDKVDAAVSMAGVKFKGHFIIAGQTADLLQPQQMK